MPLSEVSHNVQEMDSVGHKRSHDEYAGNLLMVDDRADATAPIGASVRPAGDALLPQRTTHAKSQLSPNRLDTPGITEAGICTTAHISPSLTTPIKAKSINPPDNSQTPMKMSPKSIDSSSTANKNTTTKRKRLTTEEKETKEKELLEKKRDREDQAAKKAAEKARLEEEKVARAKEREEKRKQKEEEDRLKAEQRDEKKRKKEEEQRRIQEEKEKKVRSQRTLNAFFKIPSNPKKLDLVCGSASTSPAKAECAPATSKTVETEYDKLFKPFYVRENTRLALCATQIDQDTKDAKSRMLDELVIKQQDGQEEQKYQTFDEVRHLCHSFKPARRGKSHLPVKYIMETAFREAENSRGTGDAASQIFDEARTKLASITQKVIAFSQDVRPPYYGTMTLKPFTLGRRTMSKLARRPMSRRLPLDYDYDSEAEWQEEDGEDVDMDDDEEDVDDDDDMDGFLDDTEDTCLSRRAFSTTLEPESTGICFENHLCVGPNRTVYEHKLEFMHEGLEQTWGIDPFSSQYWETETKAKLGNSNTATTLNTSRMPPPPAPSNAFAALKGEPAITAAASAAAKLVKAELMNDVKQAILDNKALSKVGIIDFIFHQFRDNVSRAEVKNTLEHVAEKKGAGRCKEWDLKPGHEIVS